MLPAEPDYALIRRILRDQGGTVVRRFRYNTESAAKRAWEADLNKTIFTSLSELAERSSKWTHNEVMAHVKWGPKAKIAYFKDNLPSKLRAISLAHDMSLKLRQQRIDNGEEVEDSKISKKLPEVEICAYLPSFSKKSANTDIYTLEQQKEDIANGLTSWNLNTKTFARFLKLQKNNFKKEENDQAIDIEELQVFIKIAADLSYESSILFFENFFLPHQDEIKKALARANKLYLLRDIFRCVPPEERPRLINPLLKTPTDSHNHPPLVPIADLRGYYLHSLLRFECLEPDVNELLERLEKEPDINLNVFGQSEHQDINRLFPIVQVLDRNGNTPLHLAAAKGKKIVVERLLDKKASLNETNKDGKTALDLAFESGHMELAKFLSEKGGIFKDRRTLLHMAAWKNKMNIVQSIVSFSSDKDVIINFRDYPHGITPLHLAAEAGNYEIVKYLLDNGAHSDYQDYARRTPLYCTDSPRIAELLIAKGANVHHYHHNQEEGAMNCLGRAVKTGNIEMVQVLSKYYDFPGSDSSVGCFHLRKAVEYNRLVAADFLIGLGVKYSSIADMENFEWRNPLYSAIENKNDAILDFLLTKDTYPLPSLFDYGRIFLIADLVILAGSVIGYFSSPKEYQELIPLAVGIPVGLVILMQICVFLTLACIKKTVDEKVTEYRAQQVVNPLRDTTLQSFDLGPNPSVEQILEHLVKLSLSEAATRLLNIADVDPKLALYSIIRLFNSDTKKASEILYQISQLQLNKENFLKLFDEPCSNEREVLIGCIKERIQAENTEQAQQIFLMFSSKTQKALSEKIDHHRLYPPDEKARLAPLLNVEERPDSKHLPHSSSRDILLPRPRSDVKEKKLLVDDSQDTTISHTFPPLTLNPSE